MRFLESNSESNCTFYTLIILQTFLQKQRAELKMALTQQKHNVPLAVTDHLFYRLSNCPRLPVCQVQDLLSDKWCHSSLLSKYIGFPNGVKPINPHHTWVQWYRELFFQYWIISLSCEFHIISFKPCIWNRYWVFKLICLNHVLTEGKKR